MDGYAGESVIWCTGLCRDFGTPGTVVHAVSDVALAVPAGESLAVMGPSGCGKSSLLHLLGALDRPSAGEVWLAGQRIDRLTERALARVRRQGVGFVFQAFHLMDELTAAENVELPALINGQPATKARARARELLDSVGLGDRARFLPRMLSGGQRQRVAIARAMVNHPLVVLADEPTGNLDSAGAADVMAVFAELHSSGQTLVVVTHDEAVANSTAHRAYMRDGAIVAWNGALPDGAAPVTLATK